MKTEVSTLDNKRKASELSPTQLPENSKVSRMEDNRKVCDMKVKDLKLVIEDLTKKIIKDMFEQVQLLTTEVAKLQIDNTELRKEVQALRVESDMRRRDMIAVEDQVKRKNVIVKGLPSNNSPRDEFSNLCTNRLNLNNQAINIRAVRKIFDRNNKMGIVAELNSEAEVYELLKNSSKLAGTQITIERDLNREKQIQKKVMLQVKKDVLQADRSQRVTVRDEKMRIAGRWFYWNQRKEFTSGNANGISVLDQIYGKNLNVNLNYLDILSRINNVNNEI